MVKIRQLIGVMLFGLALTMTAGPAGRELPELNWEQRSDWINVRTDVTPAAKGDGVADDTAAIQAALNQINMRNRGKKGVYLPPGTYRITRTLTNPHDDLSGLSLIGHGRSTVVVWDGAENGVMFHSNGIHRSRYVGIVWDGRDRAAVAFDHRSQGRYETRIRHQNEAFRNLRETGLRVGYQQKMASAEMWMENCLFEKCRKAGIEFLAWNDYDNTISGCGFYDCGIAVNVEKGNVYVRDCHFENSTKSDFLLCTHSHSIRRCTSLNSNLFVESPVSGGTQEIIIEDCQVDGWKNPNGAIVTRMRGPNLVMDTVFRNPPSRRPVINLDQPRDMLQHLVYSNLTLPDGLKVVESRDNTRITEIPAGRLGGALTDARQTFLRNTWRIPGKVFDVLKFGAKGDGSTDDTAAIEQAIAAARAHGKDAIAYLPPGSYKVTRTLEITGSDYFVGGSGNSTIIKWGGAADGGPVFRINGAQRVMLEQFQIQGPLEVCKIEHRGNGGPSWIGYDAVFVGGSWLKEKGKLLRGLECVNLTSRDVIHAPHFDGSMKFINSTSSENLISTSYDGVIEIEGGAHDADDFIAFLSRANSGNAYDVVVRDSQSLVMSDYYTEQTQRLLHLSGKAGDRPGMVFIQGAKAGTDQKDSMTIDNYRGTLYFGNAQFCYTSPEVKQQGANPVDLIFLANMFWDRNPVFSLGTAARLILVENVAGGKLRTAVDNQFKKAELERVARALDYSRMIGRRDLKFNYPEVKVKE